MKSIILENSNKKGHYSPGMISNGMLYISGQLPFDYEKGKMVEGDITIQLQKALSNVGLVLSKAGLIKENVVQCRIYISNINHWDAVNDGFATFFGSHKPSRVIVPSRELHNNALIEIEAIAEMEEE
jgi:reactive intermediate/imine deaminase